MDSSEIGTAARLLRGILERSRAPASAPAPEGPASPAPATVAAPEPPSTRAARMERILAALCATPGVHGAVLSDASGLPVASHGGLAPERLAAFSSLLGPALDGAGRLLGADGADRATLRLSDDEEALLVRFASGGLAYQLILRCAPRAAERADLRAAVAALRAALGAPTAEG